MHDLSTHWVIKAPLCDSRSAHILYIKTEFAKVCSGLGIFQVAKTPQKLTVLVP